MDYWNAFRYSYLTALGDFNYSPWFYGSLNTGGTIVEAGDNDLRVIGWGLLLACTIVTNIVMLNLLIAIISGRFDVVREKQVLFMYQEKAIAIAQF